MESTTGTRGESEICKGARKTGTTPMQGGGGDMPAMTGSTNDEMGLGGDNVSMPKTDTELKG